MWFYKFALITKTANFFYNRKGLKNQYVPYEKNVSLSSKLNLKI